MKIVKQGHEILSMPEGLLQMLEKAGRTCYKSEDKITDDSAEDFVGMLIRRGHHAMIEFGDIIVKFVTNRGVTHEMVRHRLSSFAQESTRYVRYDGDMEFILPEWFIDFDKLYEVQKGTIRRTNDVSPEYRRAFAAQKLWKRSMSSSEEDYKRLLEYGWKPQQAREILPNSLKTEIVWKANIREWRHIFSLRCSKAAHPQMRTLMIPLLKELQIKLPIIFDNIAGV